MAFFQYLVGIDVLQILAGLFSLKNLTLPYNNYPEDQKELTSQLQNLPNRQTNLPHKLIKPVPIFGKSHLTL